MEIVASEDVLGGEPRPEGRRVSVLGVAERVLTHGESPATVADQLELSLTEVHEALAYYHGDVEQMERLREHRTEREADLEAAATASPERAER